MRSSTSRMRFTAALIVAAGVLALVPGTSRAQPGTINDVQHILILMMENRTFDSYLGQLATKGYYSKPDSGCDYSTNLGCTNQEVDGLDCSLNNADGYVCANSNPKAFSPAYPDTSCAPDTSAGVQTVFHQSSYCTADTDHDWGPTHHEFNECAPTGSTGLNDGFYVRNIRSGPLGDPIDPARAMSFYDDTDLPFYYSLASAFAIGDRYFCSILGPTIPNRMYLLAGTSFGHVHTAPDLIPPPGQYTPDTGTIFDRLDAAGISWKNYFQDLPQAGLFRPTEPVHFGNIEQLFVDLENPLALDGQLPAELPAVAFIDPPFLQPQVGADAMFNVLASDEHPPKNIQTGQQFVARVVSALMKSPHWAHTALFITYDEHGGFYDHVSPPSVPSPDTILPGACPTSTNGPLLPLIPGASEGWNSAFCTGDGDAALNLVPFDRLGFRVPFYVVSPFARRHYVSHTVLDHTSLLKFIEMRHSLSPLTGRDGAANAPLDVFDFANPDTTPPGLANAIIDPNKITDPRCFEGVEVF